MRKRWLDMPSLSQGNEANEKVKEESMKWCGRASSSMVYNYYQTVLGNTSKYIKNDQGKGDLLYWDGSVAAEGYVLSAPLNAALKGWKRTALYPRADRNLPLSTMQIATVLQPVLDSIDRNNPLVAYTALSKNLMKARHIVVISGYREESDGEIWLLIDDPATMCDTRAEKEKTDYIGIENLEILDPGLWYERGSRYWLRASRLFEKNDFSESSDDLWCDHHDRPGFVVFGNDADTPDSQYSHLEETPRSSLPMLVSGIEDISPTPEKIDAFFTHTEKDFSGGYFPVGANTTWHSGIHLLGEEGGTVHAVADGTVVCARMPWEDREQDRLKFGSRNFVLIRHGRDDQVWYSLYYHLKSVDMLNDTEAEKIEWLKSQQLQISLGNFRTHPTTIGNKEICTFKDGEMVEIVSKITAPWYGVKRPEDGMTGYVYYDPGRMKEVAAFSRSRAELFRTEGVYQIDVPIKAGDIIGFVGDGITIENNSIVKKPILHWSVFSSELVSGSWKYMLDNNEDFTCDCKALVDMIDQKIEDENGVFQADGHLSREEIEEFFKDEEKAKKLRRYAFKFKTEWAVEWEKHANTIKKAGMRPNISVMNLYNWWNEAVKSHPTLPSNGHLWHYNPIHFLERKLYPCTSASFLADSFVPDSSFLLPSAYTLVERIGSYASKNRAAEITIIGMSGTGNDTKTDPDLSEARATSITLFLNDQKSVWVDRFSYKTKAKTNQGVWNHYERQLLLTYFGTYTGDAVDENTPEQQNAVRAFQNRYGLTVDGNAGPATLGKMYELIRGKMGNPMCPECCIVAGNDTHQNHGELLAHVILWYGKQFPAVSEYSTDPENVYNQWLDSVTMCIDAEPCEYYEEPLVLYSPQRNEYILVKDVENLENEIQTMDDILEKLEKAREEKDVKAQGNALSKASQEAVSLLSQDIGETLDPKKNIEELIALDKERF
ncbi:MAG: peptidoglycan-binding protein, partial [Chitinispirillaceae bacterium]